MRVPVGLAVVCGVVLVVMCFVLSPVMEAQPEQSLTTKFGEELRPIATASDPAASGHKNAEVQPSVPTEPVREQPKQPVVAPPSSLRSATASSSSTGSSPSSSSSTTKATEPVEEPKKEAPTTTTVTTTSVSTKPAAAKCDYSKACALEKKGHYEESFAMLEALRDDEGCGSEDWEVVKVLGSGMSGQVRLQKTPCGLLHAVKEPPKGGNSIGSEKMLRQHIHVDCFVLKHLASVVDGPKCDGCFPRYYYHSESSGSCYNEFVDSVPLTKFLKAQNMTEPEGVNAMKLLFHQAIDALDVLKGQDMVHRDLQAQNMLVRLTPDDPSRPFKLVIMDFCWLNWAGSPHKFSTSGRKLGRFTRTPDWPEHGEEDTYAFACAVADVVYMGGKEFKNKDKYRTNCLPDMDRKRVDKSSLEYVVWRMTQQKYEDREHSFSTMHKLVDSVKRVFPK